MDVICLCGWVKLDPLKHVRRQFPDSIARWWVAQKVLTLQTL